MLWAIIIFFPHRRTTVSKICKKCSITMRYKGRVED